MARHVTATEQKLATASSYEWRTVPLRDVSLRTEYCDPKREPFKEFEYIDVSSISRDSLQIRSSTRFRGGEAPSRARKKVRSGDVLFATVRPSLRRVAIVPPELEGAVCSTAFTVVRADEDKANCQFLFFAMSSDQFISQGPSHARGSSYPAVTDGAVIGAHLILSPL